MVMVKRNQRWLLVRNGKRTAVSCVKVQHFLDPFNQLYVHTLQTLWLCPNVTLFHFFTFTLVPTDKSQNFFGCSMALLLECKHTLSMLGKRLIMCHFNGLNKQPMLLLLFVSDHLSGYTAWKMLMCVSLIRVWCNKFPKILKAAIINIFIIAMYQITMWKQLLVVMNLQRLVTRIWSSLHRALQF